MTALQTMADDDYKMKFVPSNFEVNQLAFKRMNSPRIREIPFKPKPVTLENFTTEDIVNVGSARFKDKLAKEREAP